MNDLLATVKSLIPAHWSVEDLPQDENDLCVRVSDEANMTAMIVAVDYRLPINLNKEKFLRHVKEIYTEGKQKNLKHKYFA